MDNNKQVILIVDDNTTNLGVLSDYLDKLGFEVRIARNGSSALDRVALDLPDLILLDVMMPGLDGFETCKRLKEAPETQNIPIIFMTALTDTTDVVKGLSLGAVDYITKPLQQEEVIARIQLHLKLRTLTKKLESQNTLLQIEVEQRKTAEEDLQQALQRLQTAQKQIIAQEKMAALGTLTAGIAHELRNPLNFINNYAEGSIELIQDVVTALDSQTKILESDVSEELNDLLADIQENASSIHRHGLRAEGIISSMMKHSIGNGDQDFEEVDLNELVEEAVHFSTQSLRTKNPNLDVQIDIKNDPSIGKIKVIAGDFSRALINLVDNAYAAVKGKKQGASDKDDYSPAILVTIQKRERSIEIRIHDNGTGIPQDNLHKIFDPFFTTKPTGEGTGLGLSICHDIIVGQHGGNLNVSSELGNSTDFIITMPLQ